MTQRRLILDGPHRLHVETVEPRPLAPDEIRLVPAAVGVCGSDVHGYAGVNDRRAPGTVMGHEAVGRVVEVGDDVRDLSAGTAVAVNPVLSCGACAACLGGRDNLCADRRLYGCVPGLAGGFADAMVVRRRNAVVLAGPAPLEWGALAEPFAVGVHATAVAGIGPADAVLVVGGGPIGIGAALAVHRRGARAVVVSEPDAHRREVAVALGCAAVGPENVDPAAADVAIECVGLAATPAAALEGVRRGGRVVMVGVAAPTVAVPVPDLVMDERALLGSAVYTHAEFEATARWIASGAVDLERVIERRVQLDALPEIFAAYAAGSERSLKTIMTAG
jgi:2-desacetyl-2-hydroxyethyl bacteriochlorophyllide A dehydrogenase